VSASVPVLAPAPVLAPTAPAAAPVDPAPAPVPALLPAPIPVCFKYFSFFNTLLNIIYSLLSIIKMPLSFISLLDVAPLIHLGRFIVSMR
jgi:hypothetical protein